MTRVAAGAVFHRGGGWGLSRRLAARLAMLLITEASCLMALAEGSPMRLFDFNGPDAVERWYAINDGVMGGVSQGALRPTGQGTAEFSGLVSLENSGGFASVRSQDGVHDLGRASGLELRVRGDGRLYKIKLKTDRSFDGILYRAAFSTRAGEWQTLRLPFADFEPSFRGRVVPGAPPLEPAKVRSVGLMISDRQAGPFRLEIACIGTYLGGS